MERTGLGPEDLLYGEQRYFLEVDLFRVGNFRSSSKVDKNLLFPLHRRIACIMQCSWHELCIKPFFSFGALYEEEGYQAIPSPRLTNQPNMYLTFFS